MFEPIFPGMDPFIENQKWMRFHNALVMAIADELSRLLVPLYSVDAESYIYLGMRPDIYIGRGRAGSEPLEHSSLAIAEATSIIPLTMIEEDDPPHVAIRDEDGNLTTIIEVLSPSNKVSHRTPYLANRMAIFETKVHLIEIDLLRGGKRMESKMPKEGYNVLVARAQPDKPHRGELYEIGVRDPLPVIPVPLKPGDNDVPLNLPELVKQVYINARYRLQLNYQKLPALPFSPNDQAWVDQVLRTLP